MGVYLSEPETSKNIVTGENDQLSFCSAEMQGWRKNMEDAAIHEINLNGNAVFGVFDGHGGPQVSNYVQKIFIKQLTTGSLYQKGDYLNALQETFKRVDTLIDSPQGAAELKKIRNKLIQDEGQGGEESIANGTGCTANVVLITPNKIYVANAGDSRSAMSQGGKTIQMSYDHKPELEEEEKRIKKAGGVITMGRVNGGLNLTRAFGDFGYKRNTDLRYDQQMVTCKPDVKEFDRKPEDEFIIMGCDGIWEKFVQSSQGMIQILKSDIQKGKSLTKIVEDLLDSLLAKDTKDGLGCDNMSAILIKFK